MFPLDLKNKQAKKKKISLVWSQDSRSSMKIHMELDLGNKQTHLIYIYLDIFISETRHRAKLIVFRLFPQSPELQRGLSVWIRGTSQPALPQSKH